MHFRCYGETWFVANRFMRAPRGSKTESAIGIAPHRLSPAYVENQGSASTYKTGHLGIFACCHVKQCSIWRSPCRPLYTPPMQAERVRERSRAGLFAADRRRALAAPTRLVKCTWRGKTGSLFSAGGCVRRSYVK